MKKLLMLFVSVMALSTLTACDSTNSARIEEGGDIDSSLIDDSGVITVDSNYTDNYNLSAADRQKFEALKQDNMIYFAYDSDRIAPQYEGLIQAHATFLRNHPEITVIIEGHTDERGTPEYNVALGERRAKSVALYMQNLGVAAAQMSIVSYGEEKPLDLGMTEEAFAKNRRAVLSY
ncbi:MAG: peptidoglycan-associated lipoprotein Pal [Succinivibrionaceae bacterium]|jgi:peptidoglycan-associated lipoprotein|nr:peptidoglycan-associated lipoprotein Pal [Succinivibrionaceae bacterium]